MQRDDRADGNSYDPEAELRNRIQAQQGQGDPPAAAPDPVWGPPVETPAPPPDPGQGQDTPAPWTESNPWEQPAAPQPQPQQQPENQGITDPPVQAPDPNAGLPIWQQPWTPGSDHPQGAPPGQHWDPNMANFVPDAAPTPSTQSGYNGGADQTILQLLQSGMSPQQAIQTFNQKNGRGTGNEAVYYNDNRGQTIGLPSGYAALTPNGWTWTVRTPEGPAAAPKPAAAPAAAPRPAAAPQQYQFQQVAGQQAPQGQWSSDFVNQIRQILMQRLQAAGQPVDPNNPSIAGPMTAARDEATRSSDKERTALAENLYAKGGLNTDAISQKIQQSGESNAQGLSSLRAQLMTRELQSRKDEMTQLMQMALASGDAESARAIQMQIAALNAEINREGMSLDAGKYAAYLNQNAVMAGLG